MFKILLIDEETPLRELYRHDLELDGYRVVTAGSSNEGLDKVESDCPDLVVIDAHNHDGVEIVRQLVSHCPRIPVVLHMEPRGKQDDLVRRSADAFIRKSRDTATLRRQIQKLVAPDCA